VAIDDIALPDETCAGGRRRLESLVNCVTVLGPDGIGYGSGNFEAAAVRISMLRFRLQAMAGTSSGLGPAGMDHVGRLFGDHDGGGVGVR